MDFISTYTRKKRLALKEEIQLNLETEIGVSEAILVFSLRVGDGDDFRLL